VPQARKRRSPFRDRGCGPCDRQSHDQLVAAPRCKCDIKKGEKNSKAKASVGKSEHASIVKAVIQMSPCATDIDTILKTKKNGGRMR
jgi:biotin synthase-related radical SAM superfamily protein